METKWDSSKWDQTIQEYAKWSTRTWRQIVDTKAFYVARKAIWFGTKADTWKIKTTLGGMVSVNRLTKSGKTVKRRQVQLVNSSRVSAPLAALIINARRGRAGEAGLHGREMDKAVRKLLASRMRSVAFLKSGWLGAVKALAPFADRSGQPAVDVTAKQIGRAKGEGHRSGTDYHPQAEIVNLATARRDSKGALVRYESAGLRTALADEEKSMNEYIERKMKADADKFNRAQHS